MTTENDRAATAARAGDRPAFAELTERYRPELAVHCYRLLGSWTEAEDLVQETFLRAWRRRETYEQRATFRAWLYGIATNACLDAIAHRPEHRRTAGPGLAPAAIPWLQPCPDRALDAVAPRDAEPEAVAVRRETIELAFLAAVQHLAPRERAALILRDVAGWPAKEAAEQLGTTVAAVNSAVQRARQTLKENLPERRGEWSAAGSTEQEQAVVRRYVTAIESADAGAIAAVLREDARLSQQPGAAGNESAEPGLVHGRDAILAAWAPILSGPRAASLRLRPVAANRGPAVATYVRTPGSDSYRPFGFVALTVDGDRVSDLAVFGAEVIPLFGLPAEL